MGDVLSKAFLIQYGRYLNGSVPQSYIADVNTYVDAINTNCMANTPQDFTGKLVAHLGAAYYPGAEIDIANLMGIHNALLGYEDNFSNFVLNGYLDISLKWFRVGDSLGSYSSPILISTTNNIKKERFYLAPLTMSVYFGAKGLSWSRQVLLKG